MVISQLLVSTTNGAPENRFTYVGYSRNCLFIAYLLPFLLEIDDK